MTMLRSGAGATLATVALLLAGCGGSGGAENGTAAANGPAAAAAPDTDDAALDYARLFVPAEQVTEQGVALFRQTFDDGFASGENAGAEREHPGLRQAAQDAGADAMRTIFRRELPGMQRRIADAVRPLASAAELREIIAFMRTDTAAAMQRAAGQGMNETVRARASEGGDPLRPHDPRTASAGPVSGLTPAQTAEATRFAATPGGEALGRIAPVAAPLLMRETDALSRRAEPEIAAAIQRAVRERTGR